MKYTRVHLDAMGYDLAPNVMTSASLEQQLAQVYEALHIQPGQLEALTGIRERRWWDPGHANAQGAIAAGQRALERSNVSPSDLGVLIYGGVNRDHLEPATACAVAAGLGLRGDTEVYDISNACLGVMNGIVAIANKIELGQIRAGMVTSCETAREINETMIERMDQTRTMDSFRLSIATLTGGSGAVAYLLTDGSFSDAPRPRLLGGIIKAAPEHHRICRWEMGNNDGNRHGAQYMETDAVAVMEHGIKLGLEAWEAFLAEMGWTREDVNRVICHQVGLNHRNTILKELGIEQDKDFSTFEYLGNMGTVSLPLTAALAEERGFIEHGHRLAFLGIGSGLNCLMLGWEW